MSYLIIPPLSDYIQRQKLEHHRPSFWTVAGLRPAALIRIEYNKKRRLTAIYDLEVRNPHTGYLETTRHIYGIDRHGNPVRLKEFPTRYSQ